VFIREEPFRDKRSVEEFIPEDILDLIEILKNENYTNFSRGPYVISGDFYKSLIYPPEEEIRDKTKTRWRKFGGRVYHLV
jgi:hypothetical protein